MIEADAADDETFEIEPDIRSPALILLDRARCDIALAEGARARLDALANGARSLAVAVGGSFIARADVVDELYRQALNCGMGDDPGENVIIATIARGLNEGLNEGLNGGLNGGVTEGMNGHAADGWELEHPPQGEPALEQPTGPPPPLTIEEWLARDLPAPDFLLGSWLTATSRVLFTADTGLGKTNFSMAVGFAVAAGSPFLHWSARRTARVLYIDGEMSRLLLRQRIADAAKRLGAKPAGFSALSHEDIEGFAPLNTPAGQACIERIIKQIGGVDLVIFDSIMCLVSGNMKDEEPWQQTLPWVRSLTRRNIAQIWINHTGHDATRGYGTKTREWQMDTVLHADAVERADADVSFSLRFPKARERAPQTRADFEPLRLALVNDEWQHDGAVPSQAAKVPPLAYKFLDALKNALASQEGRDANGRRSVPRAAWRAEAAALGLTDPEQNSKSASTLFNTNRRTLIAANLVGSNEQDAWLI